MNGPLVSVIIPTYNRAATLRRTLDSALSQTYRPLEVIVVDDGSTDETREVLAMYGDRVRSIHRPNGGPSAARNTGAEAAAGGLLAFLDSDDAWQPGKIARQVTLMEASDGRLVCCMCNASMVDESGEVMATTFEVAGVVSGLSEGYWLNPAALFATRFILFNQVALICREAFWSVGGFKQELRLLEDYDLAFRLARLGPWGFVGEPLVDKFSDTVGLSAAAMQDPLVHSKAWHGVIEGFLRDGVNGDPVVERLVRRALAEVKAEIRLLSLLQQDGWRKWLASSGLWALRATQSLRRRSPWWPRPQVCENLPLVLAGSPLGTTTRAPIGDQHH